MVTYTRVTVTQMVTYTRVMVTQMVTHTHSKQHEITRIYAVVFKLYAWNSKDWKTKIVCWMHVTKGWHYHGSADALSQLSG